MTPTCINEICHDTVELLQIKIYSPTLPFGTGRYSKMNKDQYKIGVALDVYVFKSPRIKHRNP